MRKKILAIISILFGLMFVNAGLNKFFNYMPAPKDLPESMVRLMTAFAEITWLMPLVAVVEIVGGILFMFGKYRALGAIVILFVMMGILLTHIINAPSGLPIAGVLAGVNLWAIIENRKKYLPMIKSG